MGLLGGVLHSNGLLVLVRGFCHRALAHRLIFKVGHDRMELGGLQSQDGANLGKVRFTLGLHATDVWARAALGLLLEVRRFLLLYLQVKVGGRACLLLLWCR
jgi:hypothetical protein